MTKDELLNLVRHDAPVMSLSQKLRLVLLLSYPAIIAQISSVAMQIIDAAMLGHLGTHQAAAVGLVSTTIWLFGGLVSAFSAGFSVQVAHYIGADNAPGARNIIRQGIVAGLIFSSSLMLVGLAIAPFLPVWLGAGEEIHAEATTYFSIVAFALPILQMNTLAAGSLRCSGNIKTPSALGVMMCTLDVLFNYIFIFHLGMGTAGAAWGTFTAYAVSMVFMLYWMVVRDNNLRLSLDNGAGRFRPQPYTLKKAMKIGAPISLERGVMCGAQIAISGIIAPMGSVAIAANTFGINIESLCYMPGYGISEAATTLVGQSMGAKRQDLMRSFAWISLSIGMAIMALMGVVMWIFAPEMMQMVTTDGNVIKLGTEVLRIEAWAEPFFAASIVAYGVFVGSGRTLVPSVMNLGSIWVVRLTLAVLLAPTMGLKGVWIAMAVELTWRGSAFIVRLMTRGWSRIKENSNYK